MFWLSRYSFTARGRWKFVFKKCTPRLTAINPEPFEQILQIWMFTHRRTPTNAENLIKIAQETHPFIFRNSVKFSVLRAYAPTPAPMGWNFVVVELTKGWDLDANFTPSVQFVAPAGQKPQNRSLCNLNTIVCTARILLVNVCVYYCRAGFVTTAVRQWICLQELIRRWDSERELLCSTPGSYPNSLK